MHESLYEKKQRLESTLKIYEDELEKLKNNDDIQKLDAKQQAVKLMMNSLYGSLANQYFRYYDEDIAEGITTTGRVIIQTVWTSLNRFLNKKFETTDVDYIIAGDTDSAFVNLGPAAQIGLPILEQTQHINRFIETEIADTIKKIFGQLSDYLNCYQNYFSMKREAIANVCVWRGKKNYVMQITDLEGIVCDPPKIKYVGIESQRSSTPTICRESLKTCIKIILNGTEKQLQEEVKKFKALFMGASVDKVAFPRGVNDIGKWLEKDGSLKSGSPIHVKASVTYNRLRESKSLQNLIPKIFDSNKIKYVYLVPANPTGNNTIGFLDALPSEFGLDRYIDWSAQYEKAFLGPLNSIAQLAKMQSEPVSNLDSFFS